MKFLPLLLPLTLAAQEPLTYQSFGNLFSSGDFGHGTADGLPDLVVADQASGTYSVAFSQPGGQIIWKQTTESGFTNLSGLTVGKFQTNKSDDFALVAPLANRVTFWRPDATSDSPLVRHLYPSHPGTDLITGIPIDNDSTVELITTGDDGGSSTREAFDGDLSLWSGDTSDPISKLWTVRHDRTPGSKPKAVFVSYNSLIWANATSTELTPERPLPGFDMPPDTRITYGYFNGSDLAHLLFFKPGNASANASQIINFASGWAAPTSLDFPKPLELLVTVPVGNISRLVALYQDHTAALFNYDGSTLSPLANLAGSHDLLAPMGENRLMSRDGDQWSTIDATTGLVLENGSLPGGTTGSNILFVSSEPFADPAAAPLFSGQVANWTISATGGNESWTVTSLTQSSDGLIPAPSEEVNPNPGSDHALVNQYRSDISIGLVNAAPGPATGDIFISPSGGNFLPILDEPLEIQVNFSTTFPEADVFYRLANGPWLPAAAALTLTEPGTLQAYAEWNGLRTPVRQAVFTSSTTPALAIGSFTDANNNGMSDQWEESFGLSDPNGDADGDGATNLEEYQNSTDPRNAANGGIVNLPQLQVSLDGEEILIRWPRSLENWILQQSSSLSEWSNITTGIEQNGAFFEYRISSPATGSGYYRLTLER